jgi:hypothetical protein
VRHAPSTVEGEIGAPARGRSLGQAVSAPSGEAHACGGALAQRSFSPSARPPFLLVVRLLEIVFLASLLLSGVALFIAPDRRTGLFRYRPAVPITLALVHAFIDEGRWQLFVAYGLAALVSIAASAAR